jgi:hypothetical protein
MSDCPFGYRIVGPVWGMREPVIAASAFAGYSRCDERIDVCKEVYLSAFSFGQDFLDLLKTTSSAAGFAGSCCASWLWWDVDRATDLEHALRDARRIAGTVGERFQVDDELLCFFSGAKGFHVGLPTCLWQPEPSTAFNRIARRFAEAIAERAGVRIDTGVYDKVRAFRAPNSRHPKTGLYKRRLKLDELTGLCLDAIVDSAKHPEPFELPTPAGRSEKAAADWLDAVRAIEREAEEKVRRRAIANGNGSPKLNRLTLEFIRDGAGKGDRHRLLFSAAANLAEFGCPYALAHSLLTEAALDTGLTPSDVRRQIDCGLSHDSTRCVNLAGDQGNDKPTASPALPACPRFHFIDAKGRPCSDREANLWTWEGAPRWFAVAERSIPTVSSKVEVT